ncbi:MAG: hypothetical protein H5T99_00035, partial [Moorella sp. (in: Bacteria)]|nr:hypothetical protein [Moorella sp. (in: firmicutes)]
MLFEHEGASDLHLVPGLPAHVRVDGTLRAVGPALPVGAVKAFLTQVIDGDILATLLGREEIDLSSSYAIAEGHEIRFRLNVALAGRVPYVVLRRL